MDVGSIVLGLKIDTSGLKQQIFQQSNAAGKDVQASLGNAVTRATNSVTGTTSKAANAIKGQFSVLKGAVATAIGSGITKLTGALATGAKAGFAYKASLEQTTTAFATMTGSAAKAQSIVSSLSKMAANTPFEMSDLTSATQTLMEYGISANDAVQSMSMLGDIAQGNAQKMQSLALAYGQMSSLGKVQLQDLKQMIGVGFNPLKVISEQTGESMASLYQRISKGTLSVQEIANAMRTATSAGGAYYNSMAKQSKTLNGLISTLKENATALASSVLTPIISWVGNTALPLLIKAVDVLQGKVNKLMGVKTSSGTTEIGKLASAQNGVEKAANRATRAVSSGAKTAAKRVKKAAKDIKNNLAAFDEINNLTTANSSSSPSGKKSTTTPASNTAAKTIAETGKEAEKSGKKVNKMLEPIRNAWSKYGRQAVQSMKNGLEAVHKLIKAIGDSIKKVWLNGTGQKTVELLLQIWSAIWDIIKNIADKLREAWQKNETGTKIVQNLWNILNSILDIVLKILRFVGQIISRLDFSPLLEGVNSFLAMVSRVFEIVDKTVGLVLGRLLKGDYRGAGKAYSDGLKEAISVVQKWIADLDFSGIAKAINKALKNGLNFLSGIDVSGVFGDLGKLVATAFNKIVDFLSQVDWAAVFNTLEKSFENLLNAIISFIGEFLKTVDWEKVLHTVWEILGNMAKTHAGRIMLLFAGIKVGKGALSGILQLNGALGNMAKLITTIQGAGGISGALSGIFSAGGALANIGTVVGGIKAAIAGLWGTMTAFAAANPAVLIIAGIVAVVAALVALYKHCKTFRNFVNGLWAGIKAIFKAIANFIKKDWKELLLLMVNPVAGVFAMLYKHSAKFRNMINSLLKTLKNFFANIWKAISGFFANIGSAVAKLGKKIANSAVGKFVGNIFDFLGGQLENLLPHFANGAYVAANTPQLAVIGDNRSQGEFVAPEGKLKAAVQQAMAEERVYNAGNSATETSAVLGVLYEILVELKGKNLNIDGEKLAKAVDEIKRKRTLRTG